MKPKVLGDSVGSKNLKMIIFGQIGSFFKDIANDQEFPNSMTKNWILEDKTLYLS